MGGRPPKEEESKFMPMPRSKEVSSDCGGVWRCEKEPAGESLPVSEDEEEVADDLLKPLLVLLLLLLVLSAEAEEHASSLPVKRSRLKKSSTWKDDDDEGDNGLSNMILGGLSTAGCGMANGYGYGIRG